MFKVKKKDIYMGLRKVLAVALLAVSASAMGQADYTADYLSKTENYRQRIGHGRDSVLAEKYYVDFVNGLSSVWSSTQLDDWKKVYRPWKELMHLAPYATYNLTSNARGVVLLQKLMEYEKDPIQRYVFFRDLMMVDNFRIRNREKLNAIPLDGGATRIPLSEGTALMWKAVHYRDEGMKYVPDHAYHRDSAYQYFVNTFNKIRNEKVTQENEIGAGVLEGYFKACLDLYESDKEKYMEQFLNDYNMCLENCDQMMAVYKDVDTLQWSYYAAVRNNTQVWFNQSGAGNAENLEAYYSPRIDSIKDNYPALRNAIQLMMSNDTLLSQNVFYKACRYAYKLQPDFRNCIGMAQMAKNQLEDSEEALKYFNEADALATTPGEHFITCAQIGLALMGEPAPGPRTYQAEWETMSNADKNALILAWRSRQNVAARKINEAITYGVEAGVNGQNLAPYYLYMAQAYRKAEDEQTIDLASQSLDQVQLAYSLFPQNKINDERENIARVKANIERISAQRAEQLKDKRRAEALQRQWAEQQRKRAEEEKFWSRK